MNTLLSLTLLFLSFNLYSQNVKEEYYKDEFLKHKTNAGDAKYVEIVTESDEGVISTAVKNVKKNAIIKSYSYKGEEPVGIWISNSSERNYDFTVNYDNILCPDSSLIRKIFQDKDSADYVSPKIIGYKDPISFVFKNLIYPKNAERREISGMVIAKFVINVQGEVEDIAIKKSVHIELDKEVCRLIRMMKFSPALLAGKRRTVCAIIPVKFKLPD